MCLVFFVEIGDWCCVLIKEVIFDGLVDVYYVDFGNIKKLFVLNIKVC